VDVGWKVDSVLLVVEVVELVVVVDELLVVVVAVVAVVVVVVVLSSGSNKAVAFVSAVRVRCIGLADTIWQLSAQMCHDVKLYPVEAEAISATDVPFR